MASRSWRPGLGGGNRQVLPEPRAAALQEDGCGRVRRFSHGGGSPKAERCGCHIERSSSRSSSNRSSRCSETTIACSETIIGGASDKVGGVRSGARMGAQSFGPLSRRWRRSLSERSADAPPQFLTPGVTPVMPRFIINPSALWKTRWDAWMAILILYSIIFVPVRVGFARRACIFQADWVWDLVVDCCFAMDILLTFRTAVVIDAGERNQQVIITNTRQIAALALSCWHTTAEQRMLWLT